MSHMGLSHSHGGEIKLSPGERSKSRRNSAQTGADDSRSSANLAAALHQTDRLVSEIAARVANLERLLGKLPIRYIDRETGEVCRWADQQGKEDQRCYATLDFPNGQTALNLDAERDRGWIGLHGMGDRLIASLVTDTESGPRVSIYDEKERIRIRSLAQGNRTEVLLLDTEGTDRFVLGIHDRQPYLVLTGVKGSIVIGFDPKGRPILRFVADGGESHDLTWPVI